MMNTGMGRRLEAEIPEPSTSGALLHMGWGWREPAPARIMGLVVSAGFSLEDGGVRQLRIRKAASSCACASSLKARRSGAGFVRVLAPALVAGKVVRGGRMCGMAATA